jgi:predicted peptidase
MKVFQFTRSILYVGCMAMLLLVACASRHSFSESHFPARHVIVGNKTFGYRIYVPPNRDLNSKTPVMLFLHGSGARGDDNHSQAEWFDADITPIKDKINFIVVLPQCKADSFWGSTEMADYALAALDQSINEFNGDPDRLYLAGFSLGGYGAWQIAAVHPGKFAAIVPVAGGIVGVDPVEPQVRPEVIPELLSMLESPDPYKTVAAAIGPTPIWAFHGTEDENVPVDFTRKMVNAMRDAGYQNVKYTEYQGAKHSISSRVFNEPGLLEWLARQKRN